MLPGSASFNGDVHETAGRVALGVFGLGLATIVGAWGFQLIGGYQPCALCLEQRIPYYIGLPVVALGLVSLVKGWPACLTRGAFLLAGIFFLYGLGLAVQQSGAEWGFWAGPSDCASTGGGAPTSVGGLLQALETTKIVSCTEVQWRMFGLSFAGWNAVVSALLTVAIGWAGFSAPRAR